MKTSFLCTITLVFISISGCSDDIYEKNNSRHFPHYEATTEEISTGYPMHKIIYDRSFERTQDTTLQKYLDEAIDIAEREDNKIHYMLEKGMVKAHCYNMLYTGSVLVRSDKAQFHFIFNSPPSSIRNAEKWVYEDEVFGKRDRSSGYAFYYYRVDDSVKSFEQKRGKEIIYLTFYNNKKLASCSLTIDNEVFQADWNDNGLLLHEKKKKIMR